MAGQGDVYDPRKVIVVINGIYITNFANGSMIRIERMNDKYTPYIGAKGETVFIRHAGRVMTITMFLTHSSLSLAYINQLIDEEARIRVGIMDTNDYVKMKFSAENCVLLDPNEERSGTDITPIEVRILAPDFKRQYSLPTVV